MKYRLPQIHSVANSKSRNAVTNFNDTNLGKLALNTLQDRANSINSINLIGENLSRHDLKRVRRGQALYSYSALNSKGKTHEGPMMRKVPTFSKRQRDQKTSRQQPFSSRNSMEEITSKVNQKLHKRDYRAVLVENCSKLRAEHKLKW